MSRPEETIRVLGRCPAYGCTVRHNAPAVAARYRDGSSAPEVDRLRPHVEAAWIRVGEVVQGTLPSDYLARWAAGPHCLEHRLPLVYRRFRAIRTSSPCSAACFHAEGDSSVCRCSCGGVNHGAA